MVKTLLAKIVLIGDGAVGKTSLRTRLVKGEFNSQYLLTVGADFGIANVPVNDEYTVKFQLWDLAGQPRFSSVRKAYYSGAKGAIMVYDVCRMKTFQNVIDWVKECLQYIKPIPPVVLVGNKIDAREEIEKKGLRTVKTPVGMKLADDLRDIFKIPVGFFETSAKDNINVNGMFTCVAEHVIREFEKQQSRKG